MDPRAPHAPWLTPYLTVADPRRALDFYIAAFGFQCRAKMEDSGQIQHVEMTYKEQLILMFCPEGAFGSTAKAPVTLGVEAPAAFYVYVDDVDAFYRQALAHGAKSLMPPDDMFWGDRYCGLLDTEGYRWGFARHLGASAKD